VKINVDCVCMSPSTRVIYEYKMCIRDTVVVVASTGINDVLVSDAWVVDIVNGCGEDRREHLNVCEHVLQQ